MRFRLLCLVWLAGPLCPPLLWSQPAPGTLLWSFDTGTTIVSSPALALDGTIYVGGQPGLFAITNNGTAASNKWVFFPGESLHGSATVASDGTIYFGGGNFDFYAVNPNGSQKWVLPLQARYESTPAIGHDGTVYFVASGRLYAVTPGGVIKWTHDVDQTNNTPASTLAPVVGPDGTVFAGSFYAPTCCRTPFFYAINPDGTQKWVYTGGSGDSAAIGADGTLYLARNGVRALTPSGGLIWQDTVLASAPVAVGKDGTIYAAAENLSLYALKPNGETNWQAVTEVPAMYGVPTTTPAIDAAGTIYYCTSNALFAISPQGSVQWVFWSGDFWNGSHAFDSRTSPVVGPDGTIYCAFGSKLFAIAGTNALADSPWPMYHQNPRHTGKVEKPSLQKPQKRSDGGFQFELYGQLSNSYTVQTSTSLLSWSSLTSVLVTNVPMDVVDAEATNFPSRFYRALQP